MTNGHYTTPDGIYMDRRTVRDGRAKVELSRVPYCPSVYQMRVGQRQDKVVLVLDEEPWVMTTPQATMLGLQLAEAYGLALEGDIVVLNLNGESIHLLPMQARKLSGSLIKKADRADDWQRGLTGGNST